MTAIACARNEYGCVDENKRDGYVEDAQGWRVNDAARLRWEFRRAMKRSDGLGRLGRLGWMKGERTSAGQALLGLDGSN